MKSRVNRFLYIFSRSSMGEREQDKMQVSGLWLSLPRLEPRVRPALFSILHYKYPYRKELQHNFCWRAVKPQTLQSTTRELDETHEERAKRSHNIPSVFSETPANIGHQHEELSITSRTDALEA